MIVKARNEDKNEIYRAWKEYFAFDDGGSIDFYFDFIFDPKYCYTIRMNDEVVAALSAHKHDLSLHHRQIKASLISGVYTKKNHRRKGYMKQLMMAVLDELQHQELVTLIQAYDPSLYTPFGFEPVYYKATYTVYRDMVPQIATNDIGKEFTPSDLKKIYDNFTRRFTGYYVRSLADFELYIQGLQAERAKIIVYRQNNIVMGYAIYYEFISYLRVTEIVYLTGRAFLTMMSYLLDLNSKVKVMVSKSENIGKVIPNMEKQLDIFMMARVNDYQMFNAFYRTKVNNVQDAFSVSGLPLFINEFW